MFLHTVRLHSSLPSRHHLSGNYPCNAISFLISAIAVPGLNPFGQVREQFRILRRQFYGVLVLERMGMVDTYDIDKEPLSFAIELYVLQLLDHENPPSIDKLASKLLDQATPSQEPIQENTVTNRVEGAYIFLTIPPVRRTRSRTTS